ncbi:MAG: lysoplasmalogenase family protein, partial [Marinicella sp.]
MMWLLPAICLFACVLCIIFESKNLNKLSLKAKLLASLSFVGFAWQLEAMTTVFGKLLLSGLVLSMIGDVLLAIINHKRAFILGMIAFLIAHVMYALAFYQLGFNTAQLPLLLPVVMLMMLGTGLWLRPHLHGVFAFAVPMYLLAIGTMLILAWGNLSLTAW